MSSTPETGGSTTGGFAVVAVNSDGKEVVVSVEQTPFIARRLAAEAIVTDPATRTHYDVRWHATGTIERIDRTNAERFIVGEY